MELYFCVFLLLDSLISKRICNLYSKHQVTIWFGIHNFLRFEINWWRIIEQYRVSYSARISKYHTLLASGLIKKRILYLPNWTHYFERQHNVVCSCEVSKSTDNHFVCLQRPASVLSIWFCDDYETKVIIFSSLRWSCKIWFSRNW